MPLNSNRSNSTALEVFACFVIDYHYIEMLFSTETHLRSFLLKKHSSILKFCSSERQNVLFLNLNLLKMFLLKPNFELDIL